MTTTVEPANDMPPIGLRGHGPKDSRWGRMNPVVRYTLSFVVLAIVVVAGQLILHEAKSDPRDTAAIANRELTLNVLAPGERIMSSIAVVRRAPVDYFRATHGILVLTDRRMVFLGLRPRDMLATDDAPPTFDERDFAVDTSVTVASTGFFGRFHQGVAVRADGKTIRMTVPSTSWPEAQRLVSTMASRRAGAAAAGQRQESLLAAADREWKEAVAAWKKPQHYTVRRGDALGSIATRWNTTVESLQKMNGLADNRVRVGQSLLVREAM